MLLSSVRFSHADSPTFSCFVRDVCVYVRARDASEISGGKSIINKTTRLQSRQLYISIIYLCVKRVYHRNVGVVSLIRTEM